MVNVPGMFKYPNRPWPVVSRGNINNVQKKLKPNNVVGIPPGLPQIYYRQTYSNLNSSRTYRNTNVSDLPDGAYLYLIEYEPGKNEYRKSFVRVLDKLESGSRHFQLPTRGQGRVIVAAGELLKQGSQILFNLESGTYTAEIMTKTKNYVTRNQYVNLVKNALRSNRPVNISDVNRILLPNIPGNLQTLLNRGTVSFYHNQAAQATRNRINRNLRKAGLVMNNTNKVINATTLIRRLISGEKIGPAAASPVKRSVAPTNNGAARVERRRRRG